MELYSKTFCVYPWLELMAAPDGKVNFCCIATNKSVKDENGVPYNLGTHSFQEAWNSQYMREIREAMFKGEKIVGCDTCYMQESIGKESYRQRHNSEWVGKLGREKIDDLVEKSASDNFAVNEQPVYLDLRLGNLCNLKCRMCNPYNSTQIYREWLELDEKTNGEYSNFWAKYMATPTAIGPWYESDNFWNSVEDWIPGLKKVYMTGGEPTLINGNYRFLETCIGLGYSNQIELFFNLNFTNITDKFINLINQFKWTSINASIDGFGALNNYIRAPSKWEQIDSNFQKLCKNAWNNVGIGVSPVIQVYNVLNIIELLDYVCDQIFAYDRDILVDFLLCTDPLFLDITILPKSVKEEAIKRLESYQSSKIYNRNSPKTYFVKNSIDSTITLLKNTLKQENPELIKEFREYTRMLDENRGQSLEKAVPDLYRFLEGK